MYCGIFRDSRCYKIIRLPLSFPLVFFQSLQCLSKDQLQQFWAINSYTKQRFEGFPRSSLLQHKQISPEILIYRGSKICLKSAFGTRHIINIIQFSSVAQLCLTLCDPMNSSTLGLPVHHQLLEFTQTHVHRVGDAIQPSHPLSSPSPPAPNLSQHQGLFQ